MQATIDTIFVKRLSEYIHFDFCPFLSCKQIHLKRSIVTQPVRKMDLSLGDLTPFPPWDPQKYRGGEGGIQLPKLNPFFFTKCYTKNTM